MDADRYREYEPAASFEEHLLQEYGAPAPAERSPRGHPPASPGQARRRPSFSHILTHARDLAEEDNAIEVLFSDTVAAAVAATGAAAALGKLRSYGAIDSLPPRPAATVRVMVNYVDPAGTSDSCKAEVNMAMRFSKLAAHLLDNMQASRIVPPGARLRFELTEFRTIAMPGGAAQHVIWIFARTQLLADAAGASTHTQ